MGELVQFAPPLIMKFISNGAKLFEGWEHVQ
jgi:hypothetical protein